MKQLFQRCAALAILLLSLAWLCRDPGWEPAIAFVVALIAYVALDSWQIFHAVSAHDSNLIREFRKLFPPDSEVVEFLRDHDIAIPYHQRKTEPILRIHDEWKGVDYEFDDKTLESAKNRFLDSVRSYVRPLVNETFAHVGNPTMLTMDFSDWENPPEKIEARDRLNKLGTELLLEYETFVRVIRKKIKDTDQGLILGTDKNTKDPLTLISAHYGSDFSQVDVTPIVRGHIQDGTLNVLATTGVLGGSDPMHGRKKELTIVCELFGKERTFYVPEGRRLILP